MTEQTDLPTVACPYPGCGAPIPVRHNLPNGDYLCRCHTCTLRLGWATYANGERKPYVTLVEKKEGKV